MKTLFHHACLAARCALPLFASGCAEAVIPEFAEVQDAATHEPEHDASQVAPVACELLTGTWVGTVHGNIYDTIGTLRIHVDADHMATDGVFEWRSPSVGGSDRDVTGSCNGANGSVTLHDTDLRNVDLAPGWRACSVDSYRLQLSSDGRRLTGRFTSAACSDRGAIDLHLVP
jgi:hypothetical protein